MERCVIIINLPGSIFRIFLFSPSNPFRTENSEEFQAKIEEMSLSQMQELAVRASIFPSGNKTTLKNKLCREFKAKFNTGLKIAQVTKPVFDLNSEAAKKALEISKSDS